MKSVAAPQISPKVDRDVSKEALNCTVSIAADSIIDAISFVSCIVLWSQNKFFWNPAPSGFKFLSSARSGSGEIWNSQISYNSKY